MPYGYIYKIENIVNGKVYIGQSVNVCKRFEGHKYDLNNNKHKNAHLQNAWNKYGKDNFIFEIIDEAEEKYILDVIECFWIEAYGGYKSSLNYNYRSGGANGLQSQISKDRISKANSGDNHWLKGKHLSQEHKNKVSDGLKLFNQNNDCEWKHRPQSTESNKKRSKALKGRKISEEQKQFLRDNPPAARSVTCVETEQEFFTIKAASEYFDIDAYKIRDCAKGRKTPQMVIILCIQKNMMYRIEMKYLPKKIFVLIAVRRLDVWKLIQFMQVLKMLNVLHIYQISGERVDNHIVQLVGIIGNLLKMFSRTYSLVLCESISSSLENGMGLANPYEH